jgi:hypothetical protein
VNKVAPRLLASKMFKNFEIEHRIIAPDKVGPLFEHNDSDIVY